jgi:hypothetical protein
MAQKILKIFKGMKILLHIIEILRDNEKYYIGRRGFLFFFLRDIFAHF